MTIALAHDHYDEKHLEQVKKDMLSMGAPAIKAVWMECYNMYAAMEGCHRIRAAKELGLVPVIEEYVYDDVFDKSLMDESLGLDFDNDETVAWLLDDCHKRIAIEF